MNQRIKELVAQSGNGQMRDGKLYPHIGSRTPEDWQKFAELIVRECADFLDSFNRENMVEEGMDGAYMKKHFGVEE